jgi:4-amino-4-deoxy-L-arabinose transferase-like glycosyltransferase
LVCSTIGAYGKDRRLSERTLLIGLLVIYLMLGALFAVRTPDWQAPDEPAHYNYIAQLAANGCCPVIEMGDWDQAYLGQLTGGRFAPELLRDLDTIQYEDHQPPLYYLIAAPIYTLTNGSLTALRLLSVVIGAGVVVCAYGVGKALLPNRPQIALGAAAFVAFIPQHLAMLASANNDALAELIVGLTLLALVNLLRAPVMPLERLMLTLGLLVGLAFLTKTTIYFLAGVVPVAILLRWWITRPAFSTLLRWLGLFLLPALLMGGLWWARNLTVYGAPDFLGLARHDVVVADQMRRVDYIAEFGLDAYWRRAVEFTYNSFWGQFGWMALPMPSWVYIGTLALLALAVSGWGIAALIRLPGQPNAARPGALQSHIPPLHSQGMGSSRLGAGIILALVVLLVGSQYVYFNLEFLQHQGRYLFPALIPLGLFVALGMDAWRRLLFRGDDAEDGMLPYTVLLSIVPLLLLIPLNLYVLWRLLPSLAP